MKVNRTDLETQVRNASKACIKSPLVGYMALKLEAKGGILTIYGGSTLITVKAELPYEGDDEFTVCVNHETLLSTISKMKMEDVITINLSNKALEIACGYAKVNLTPVADTVIVRSEDEVEDSISVSGLKEMVEKTSHCLASDGQGDPKMSSFDIRMSSDGIKVLALDGKRISIRSTADTNERELIVVGKPLISVLQMLGDDVKISFPKSGKYIELADNNIVATVSVLNGEFFNIDPILSKMDSKYISINKEQILEALGIAALFGKVTKVELTDGQMTFSSIDESGAGNSQIKLSYRGNLRNVKFGVSNQFLTDAVKSLDGEEIQFTIENPTSPMLLTDGDGKLEIVLPVTIAA